MYPANSIHVYPVNDEKEHLTEFDECWCDADVQYIDPETGVPWANGGVLIIHNAADMRHLIEQAEAIKQEGAGA